MNLFAKFLKIISSETNPWQIAFAIALGMIVGFSPLLRLHNVLILLLVLVFRINIASFILAIGVFSGLAFAVDPLMVNLGENILNASALQSLWSGLYSSSTGRLLQFNHTLTMGSFALGLVLFPIVLFASRVLIVQYREHIMSRVNKFRIVRILKASTFYQHFSGLGE